MPFNDVRNPRPHERCIVSNIIGMHIISPKVSPITAEAPRINTMYTSAGMNKSGVSRAPAISDTAVARTVNGGARYRRLMLPLCLRVTTLRQRPYSKYCLASALTVERGRYVTFKRGSK